MIYFDNAATTRIKPECVYDAFNYYVREIGTSPGRGSYKLGINASRMLFQSRKTIGSFFGAPDPSNVVFTKNSTEAINLFFRGYLKEGDHVLISPFEHNAVLRPLHRMQQQGIIEYSVVPIESLNNFELLKTFIKPNTKLAAITLASNLTGQIVFNSKTARFLKESGVFVFVDSSQGAGKIKLDLTNDSIDALAFTGHKDLLSFPGVGGLVSHDKLTIEPLIQGGTGVFGDSYINPDVYPDAYEAGTLNMPAIWSLKKAIDYLSVYFFEIKETEQKLISYLLSQLKKIKDIEIYSLDAVRVSTVCFNIRGIKSNEVVKHLSDNDICVRGGIHCAILAHKTINTVQTGAVRVSINFNNTEKEINQFIKVLKELT